MRFLGGGRVGVVGNGEIGHCCCVGVLGGVGCGWAWGLVVAWFNFRRISFTLVHAHFHALAGFYPGAGLFQCIVT